MRAGLLLVWATWPTGPGGSPGRILARRGARHGGGGELNGQGLGRFKGGRRPPYRCRPSTRSASAIKRAAGRLKPPAAARWWPALVVCVRAGFDARLGLEVCRGCALVARRHALEGTSEVLVSILGTLRFRRAHGLAMMALGRARLAQPGMLCHVGSTVRSRLLAVSTAILWHSIRRPLDESIRGKVAGGWWLWTRIREGGAGGFGPLCGCSSFANARALCTAQPSIQQVALLVLR